MGIDASPNLAQNRVNGFDRMREVLAGRMPALDGLRGLAILIVVFHNISLAGDYTYDTVATKIYTLFVNMGWVGVQLFFVLSGFLITGILIDGLGRENQLRNFYMRRLLRIFPLYYVVLIGAFVFAPLMGIAPSWLEDSRAHQIWFWSYLINWAQPFLEGFGFGHFWSLAVEEQFYIFWPFLVVLLARRNLVLVCLGLIVSAIAVRALLVFYDPVLAHDAAYTFTAARWDALAIGALCALALRDAHWFERMRTWALPAVLFFGGAVVVQIAINRGFEPVIATFGTLNQTIIAALFAAVLILSVLPHQSTGTGTLLRALLASSALRFFGKYSYAIYILHVPFKFVWFATWGLKTADYHGWPLIGALLYNVLGVLTVSTLAALVSWHVLERPFLRLKRFFKTPERTALAARSQES